MRTASNTPQSSEPEGSLYARVLADPEARDAYFNTTQARLFGDELDDSVNEIIDLLDKNAVAFLFSHDPNRARPALQVESVRFVGKEEIVRAIGRLLTRQPDDHAA
ncbi:hypothetical protein BH10ACT2_BH10ACT2_19610 [soil metagenome]